MKYLILSLLFSLVAIFLGLSQINGFSPEKTLFRNVHSYRSVFAKPPVWWLETGSDINIQREKILLRIDSMIEILKEYRDLNDTTRKAFSHVEKAAWGVVVDKKITYPGCQTMIVKNGAHPAIIFIARDYGEQKEMAQRLLCYRVDYNAIFIGAIEMPPLFLAATLYHEVGHSQQGILLYDKKDLPIVEIPMHKLSLDIICAKVPKYRERIKLIASRSNHGLEEVVASISFEDMRYLDSLVLGDVSVYGHLVPYTITNNILGVGFEYLGDNEYEREARLYNWLLRLF